MEDSTERDLRTRILADRSPLRTHGVPTGIGSPSGEVVDLVLHRSDDVDDNTIRTVRGSTHLKIDAVIRT